MTPLDATLAELADLERRAREAARAWSWDNVETGAKAEHEGRTW